MVLHERRKRAELTFQACTYVLHHYQKGLEDHIKEADQSRKAKLNNLKRSFTVSSEKECFKKLDLDTYCSTYKLLSSSFRRFVNEGLASLSILHPALDLETTEERVESNDHDQAPLPFSLNDDDPGEDVGYVDIVHDSLAGVPVIDFVESQSFLRISDRERGKEHVLMSHTKVSQVPTTLGSIKKEHS
ncbi:predicted protein [Lichtheimia corymbifera JMRC:FSU:9682]|uniref:Uncharacterized protein n=1 Tax=Lichtheimia corymbifera JMRC:FSU:9682 TaxID=1263082 RepID=A0A068RYQ1_9FUNG|nr:predicted protein [Lichtheimia corymbifera JMRC:FSU:9682]CDH59616.1 predicted protein [Lichtheimia corymbifera JMRC:FSU:9682]